MHAVTMSLKRSTRRARLRGYKVCCRRGRACRIDCSGFPVYYDVGQSSSSGRQASARRDKRTMMKGDEATEMRMGREMAAVITEWR